MTANNTASEKDAAFRGMSRVLKNLPEVEKQQVSADDPTQVIIEASQKFDLTILGASARPSEEVASIGPVAEQIMLKGQHGVFVVKTKQKLRFSPESEESGNTAISVLVDKWFAENSFHADEFSDLNYLLNLKRKQQVSISLALPALNEEQTVGNVIETIKKALAVDVPLLDEIVLIDSDSSDRTRDIAAGLGIPVFIHQSVLPKYGARRGKGEALWKSLYCTHGDIIIWIDTDILNIHPHFVYGLIGPLLVKPDIHFVKGFYERPLKLGQETQSRAGGRVTELTARPFA